MLEQASQDRTVVQFAGGQAGAAPLTWGQKAILQDMRDSGSQFSMGGMTDLPEGSTVAAAAARLSGLMSRHAALRMRLGADRAGRPCLQVAGSGRTSLEVLTVPDDADPAEATRWADGLLTEWPLARFDFERDWPLRMAVVRHRGACRRLIWVLSHLAADGGGHLLMLADLLASGADGAAGGDRRRPQILDVAHGEREPQLRQLSSRAMRHWEAQLRRIPAQTFGGHAPLDGGQRYLQARFTSPAAHLAVLAIAARTGTDASRASLAVIATAIGRATGAQPLTIKVMVNNRFRPGLAEVIAPLAQNSVVTIDLADASIDEVVARTRRAALSASMRAYYDPDELADVMARLDTERGYPARVTCRVNDQRAMIMRAQEAGGFGAPTPEQVERRLPETSLTWLGPREHMHEQVNILIENRSDALSLHMMWDQACLTGAQVETVLRGVEEVAVAAAFDPSAPAGVHPRPGTGG